MTRIAPQSTIGIDVSECQTASEAMAKAQLDWRVELRPLSATLADGSIADCDENFAVVRDDTRAVLGVVGSNYRPLQNCEAFEAMDCLSREGIASFDKAGTWRGGRRIWLTAKLPREYEIAPGDTVTPYAILTSSHDGTSAVRIMPLAFRLICSNQLHRAFSAGAGLGFSILHTASMTDRLNDARRKLHLVNQSLDKLAEQSRCLARRSLSREQLANYFAGLIAERSEKQQRAILERFACNLENSRNSVGGIRGTAWGAYNAVSEWADHEMKVTGASEMERAGNRLQSIWFGTAAKLKTAAWESALALTA